MRRKNILLVLTGGTICSFPNERNERAADVKRAEALIVENFMKSDSPFSGEDCVTFHTESPLNVLSENMSIESWNVLIDALKKYDYSAYDGVIILHGTDTLAYTSSLLSILFAGTKIPVFMVSSALPLTEEKTNGNANFRAAVELIVRGVNPNVYVVYRNYEISGENSKNAMYIHYGSRLLQCANHSDNFYSVGMTEIDESSPHFDGESVTAGVLLLYSCPRLFDCVLRIMPYVGINYDRYSLDGVLAVMHGTYHSATLCVNADNAKSSAFALLSRCKERRIPFFLEPCNHAAYSYETTGEILRAGAEAISQMTSEFSYVKLLLGSCMGLSGSKLSEYMKREINREFIY